MNTNPQRAEELFAAALERRDANEQRAFLDQACAGNAALRQEVESLLAAHEGAGEFLNATSAEAARPLPPTEKPGTRIGRYKLLEQIGEGGFGVVWMAEQEEPVRRRVALKVIKLGMDSLDVDSTVERTWAFARAWLFREMQRS